MDDVEDDLALVDLDGVVDELAAVGVAAPDAEVGVVAHSAACPRDVTAADRLDLLGREVLLQLVRLEQLREVVAHRRHRLLLDLDRPVAGRRSRRGSFCRHVGSIAG